MTLMYDSTQTQYDELHAAAHFQRDVLRVSWQAAVDHLVRRFRISRQAAENAIELVEGATIAELEQITKVEMK